MGYREFFIHIISYMIVLTLGDFVFCMSYTYDVLYGKQFSFKQSQCILKSRYFVSHQERFETVPSLLSMSLLQTVRYRKIPYRVFSLDGSSFINNL